MIYPYKIPQAAFRQHLSPPLGNGVAIRHPGQVRPRRTRAGIQKESEDIELSLDSGYPPPADSGMTQS